MRGRIVALFTRKGHCFRVSDKVNLKLSSCFEVLITLRAEEKFFLRINQRVCFEVVPPLEGLFTLATRKGLFIRMSE